MKFSRPYLTSMQGQITLKTHHLYRILLWRTHCYKGLDLLLL